MVELTKDADKMICCLYKEYLQRIKYGNSKSSSRSFKTEYTMSDKVLSQWHNDDICTTKAELKRKGLLKVYVSGSFELTENAVSYMESRFKSGITEVTKYIADLISDVATGLIL